MIGSPKLALFLATVVLALGAGSLAAVAHADESDGGAAWRLEQPLPPELPNGQKSTIPIGLGKIGDIEFWAPNRGLLITAGNPETIPPSIWAYNGVAWHELAEVCGASDGRIAWAGPEEFWTVSDGRTGQADSEGNPPLADNTLCHFAGGQVVASYASLAFLPTSYQVMSGAACLGPEDCWFGGEPLPDGRVGAFHLHWNGHALSAEPGPQGHAVGDMRRFGSHLYESVRISSSDQLSELEPPTEPSVVHKIEPNGIEPTFVSLFPVDSLVEGEPRLPIYSAGESPEALDFPHLSSDEQALWAASDPTREPHESTLGEVTVLRDTPGERWSQVIGASTDPEGANPFTKEAGESPSNELVESIAAEPTGAQKDAEDVEHAWLALSSRENTQKGALASAMVARLSSTGAVSERQTLPSTQEAREGVAPKGTAAKIACPAVHDCWMATSDGWLFHLAPEDERRLPEDTDPAFSGLITYRPPDEGVPATVPDAPPEDDSGLLGEAPAAAVKFVETKASNESRITVPLLSAVHTRLVKGTTLELRFRLAVRARVRLLAERHKHVVASTATRTLAAGNRELLLRLDRDRWPTKLNLKTQALAPLPTVSLRAPGNDTVTTSLVSLIHVPSFAGLGPFG